MKKLSILFILSALLVATGCRKDLFRQPLETCGNENSNNAAHPLKDSVEAIMAR